MFAGNETSPESFLLHNALARKPKRIRTAFSPSQLLRLEHAFEKNHYVVGAERKQLAHSLSLTETQVRTAGVGRRETMFWRLRCVRKQLERLTGSAPRHLCIFPNVAPHLESSFYARARRFYARDRRLYARDRRRIFSLQKTHFIQPDSVTQVVLRGRRSGGGGAFLDQIHSHCPGLTSFLQDLNYFVLKGGGGGAAFQNGGQINPLTILWDRGFKERDGFRDPPTPAIFKMLSEPISRRLLSAWPPDGGAFWS